MEQGLTLRHSSIHCSFTGPFINGDIGCSADLTGYPDFAPIKNNTVDGNLFVASPGSGYCAYGGASRGKPFSGDPTNATNQKFTNNVFQRGANGKCGTYGPVTSFEHEPSGERLVGQRVGRRDACGAGDVRATPTAPRLVERSSAAPPSLSPPLERPPRSPAAAG